MSVIIRVEDLGKQYHIGAARVPYATLRDTLIGAMRAPLRLRRRSKGRVDDTFWAIKDVSFEVQPGEVVGIIGRNGAGKSTLLKMLSRITEPTTGSIDLYGRVGSLLEVGTGFHPELSGRENIYLNGAILGMRKAEITRKFDEIAAFAEIDKFIDTPIKHYSSGMYVRLAFAVAVHLEPEVLIVDEVLAVGDAQFQKKSFEKMKSMSQGGRTILFVSHNMAALRSICTRAFKLEHGRLMEQGEINKVIDCYLAQTARGNISGSVIETASFVVNDVQIYSVNGPVIKTFDPVEIRVRFTAKEDILDPGLYVGVLSIDGQRLAGLDFKDFESVSAVRKGSQYELGFSLDSLPILPGTYQLELHLKDMAAHKIEFVSQTFTFEVVETAIYGGRKLDRWFGHIGLNARPISRALLGDNMFW